MVHDYLDILVNLFIFARMAHELPGSEAVCFADIICKLAPSSVRALQEYE